LPSVFSHEKSDSIGTSIRIRNRLVHIWVGQTVSVDS
jgi:hypothetical protein